MASAIAGRVVKRGGRYRVHDELIESRRTYASSNYLRTTSNDELLSAGRATQ